MIDHLQDIKKMSYLLWKKAIDISFEIVLRVFQLNKILVPYVV